MTAAPAAFKALKERGYPVRNPELTFATFDHVISTLPGRTAETNPALTQRLYSMRVDAKAAGVRLFDLGEPGQGIVHVIGPELGLTLPGTLLVCGDSHTCTHGGMGALAFGIGSSEVVHVLATQTHRAAPAEADARDLRRHAPARRDAQGHDPAPDRRDRRGGRHRLRRRVCGQRHPRARHRGAPDHLQSLDRAGRQDAA